MEHYGGILDELQESSQLQSFWQRYQKSFEYAHDISFNDVCNSVQKIMERMNGFERIANINSNTNINNLAPAIQSPVVRSGRRISNSTPLSLSHLSHYR